MLDVEGDVESEGILAFNSEKTFDNARGTDEDVVRCVPVKSLFVRSSSFPPASTAASKELKEVRDAPVMDRRFFDSLWIFS